MHPTLAKILHSLTHVDSLSLWAAVNTCKWSINTPDPWKELSAANITACHGYDI